MFRIIPHSACPGIYEIPCHVCDKKYIGETGRTLGKRLLEHKRDVRNGKESNACFIHTRDVGHRINWDNSRLLIKSDNVFKRRMLESFIIQKTPNFNLCDGQWKLDNLTSALLEKAFPDLDGSRSPSSGAPPSPSGGLP